MATIPQVRDAIAAAITGIPALSGRVSSGWPNQINAPCAVVHRKQTARNAEFNGGDNTIFHVTVYLPSIDLPTVQTTMDALLAPTGSGSIVALLAEGDTSLGGIVNWLTIPAIDEEGLVELLGVTYYSASISVLVSHN